MTRRDVAGISYFTYDLFEPCLRVTNAVTTRRGGSSPPPYDTLNLGLHVGDDPDRVLENRAIAAQILGFEPEALTLGRQVHGSCVALVRAGDRGRGAVAEDDAIEGADALVTNEPDIPLGILIADCVAVSLYDPAGHVIGIAHAGWKGTLARIAERTVAAMSDSFGTNPSDLLVGVSPAVATCHYDVGPNVADAYAAEFGDDAARFVSGGAGEMRRLDLGEANVHQLLGLGVPADRIEKSAVCTACTPDLFYSYRRDGSATGRFAGIVMLHSTGRRLF
jgi:YfiH family protein